MSWDKTVKQIVRESHQAGCMDVLRAFLDEADKDVHHDCLATAWARRMYMDPDLFSAFVNQAQRERES